MDVGNKPKSKTQRCDASPSPGRVWRPPGEGAVDPNDPSKESTLSQLAKTEISLTLTSKVELLEGDDKDMKGLMTK